MGMKIWYELELKADPFEARQFITDLRGRAIDLKAFEQISPVRELNAPDRPNDSDLDEEAVMWMRLRGTRWVSTTATNGEQFTHGVPPEHLIDFTVFRAGGELAHFGLAMHPRTAEVAANPRDEESTETQSIDVGPPGIYRWETLTKTQYAALPEAGGPENFLKLHLGLVNLMEIAANLGATVSVFDEGGYWENRDEQKLLEELGVHDAAVATMASRLRDAFRDTANVDCLAPIRNRPDFEKVEATGHQLEKANE